MNPRIAIPIPMASNPEYNRRNWPAYADAVRWAGGEPVEVALSGSPREIIDCAATCQAILLPGSGADVTAAKYGRAFDPSMAPADGARENVDELLLQDAHNLYKPILGVCFGAQMLNVWRSGTLSQDLSPIPVNHRAGASVGEAHTVRIAGGSLLARLLDGDSPQGLKEMKIAVNSSHHQAIDAPGDGLAVSGSCPEDGVVEVIENRDPSLHFVLGVQWHPERSTSLDRHSQALFSGFIKAARMWRPRLVTTSVADRASQV